MKGEVRSTGVKVRIEEGHRGMRRDFLEREAAYAAKSGTHLWTAIVQFKVTAEALERGTDVPMDAENLLGVHFGCFVCETPYEPALGRRACPGQPPGELQYVPAAGSGQ